MPLTTLPTGTKEVKVKPSDTQLVDAQLPEHQSKEDSSADASSVKNKSVVDKVQSDPNTITPVAKGTSGAGQPLPGGGSEQVSAKNQNVGVKDLENLPKATLPSQMRQNADELSVASLPHSTEQRTTTHPKDERSFFTAPPEDKRANKEPPPQQSIFIREHVTEGLSGIKKEPTHTVFRADVPIRDEVKINANVTQDKSPSSQLPSQLTQESIKQVLTPRINISSEREIKPPEVSSPKIIQKDRNSSPPSSHVPENFTKPHSRQETKSEIKRDVAAEKKQEIRTKENFASRSDDLPKKSPTHEVKVQDTHRYPSAKVSIQRRVILPVIPVIQRSIDWVTRVVAGEKIASPSPALVPLSRLKEVAVEARAKPLKVLLGEAFPKIKEKILVVPARVEIPGSLSPKEKLATASQRYKHLKEIVKSIEEKVIQNIRRELQPHIKELVKAEASPVDSQKLKQLIVLKDLFQSGCEKAKLVVEQSLSVIKTLQTEVKNIPQEVFESFKSLLQEIVRAALPLSTDPESLDPEQIARLMSKIRSLLSQLRDQAMASGEDLAALDDLLELLEEMELLEQIEIDLLEELLALEEARDVETLLEHEEALAEIEAIIRRDAYKKLLEQKDEGEAIEVFSLLVRVLDDNDLPQVGVFVYGGQLGVLSTNSDGEVRFENIEPDTFVIVGLDPELGISEPDTYSLMINQHEVVQFKIYESRA